MATDLTFQQLSDELPAGALLVDGGNVKIDVSALTGDSVTDLSATGVLEAFYKLIQGATAAQTALNETALEGEALSSFSTGSLGAPQIQTDGTFAVQTTSAVAFVIPLDPSTVTGPQV